MHPAAFLLLVSTAAPPPPERAMLHEYLLKECQKHFDARRQTVAGLKTADDVRKRQAELRRSFLAALGPFPEKTPLKPQVVDSKKYDGYTLERVIYESRPSHHVTANFYLPEGKGPFPGVLLPCGHSANGKAAEAYQKACILFAKHGFAVLCYDPIGQGERLQLLDAQGKPAVKGSTTEHTLTGIGALLVGQSTATYRIWDGIRSIDYLASRPEVDPKRLGCTGNSGGGTLTAYLMALDDRIVAAAPSCYITSLERLFATIGPQDAEQNILGQVAFGMEHADYVTLRAPKPTLILTGTQDFFDIQGSWTTFREAKRIFATLGHGERVDFFEYDDKHGFSQPRREAALRFLCRWLQGKDDAPTEGMIQVLKDADLQCTRTGQVLEDFKGVSVFDLTSQREIALLWARKPLAREALLKEVRRLLALPGKAKAGSFLADAKTFETEPGVRVVFAEKQANPKLTTAVSLRVGDKEYALQLRGLGVDEKQPLLSGEKEAFLALHLNRPLVGQQVIDILSAVEYLGKDVELTARGPACIAALHAAALDTRIKSLTVEGGLISWSSIVNTPISNGQLANVAPGVLAVYDVPDLAAAIAPRDLTIRNPVTAAGALVKDLDLHRIYAAGRKAYGESRALKLIGAGRFGED